jgi:PAS domain-containing protein
MARTKKDRDASDAVPSTAVVMVLYITDSGPNSVRAVANLEAICKEHLQDNFRLEIIDGLAFDWYWDLDDRYRFSSYRGAAVDAGGLAEESIIGKALWDLSIDNMGESDWRTHRQQLEWRVTFRDLEITHRGAGQPLSIYASRRMWPRRHRRHPRPDALGSS